MDRLMKITALFVLIVLAFVAFGFFFQKKEPEISGFSFANSVDENMNYVPSNGVYYPWEEMYFVMEISNLGMKNSGVSYKVDVEITNISGQNPEKTFSETILNETKSIDNKDGRISVFGRINVPSGAKLGTNSIKITVTDLFSNSKKSIQKSFRVEEWTEKVNDLP